MEQPQGIGIRSRSQHAGRQRNFGPAPHRPGSTSCSPTWKERSTAWNPPYSRTGLFQLLPPRCHLRPATSHGRCPSGSTPCSALACDLDAIVQALLILPGAHRVGVCRVISGGLDGLRCGVLRNVCIVRIVRFLRRRRSGRPLLSGTDISPAACSGSASLLCGLLLVLRIRRWFSGIRFR